MNIGEYILPLFFCHKDGDEIIEDRFAGTAFFIDNEGGIATCGHIIDRLKPGQILCAMYMQDDKVYEVCELSRHPEIDFAIGRLNTRENKFMPYYDSEIIAGLDVQSFGFTFFEKSEGEITITPRLSRGYITRVYDQPETMGSMSTCETSFPSLNGYSGAPVYTLGESPKVIGMLFNNAESTIEIYSYKDINDAGDKYSEEVHRVVEHGLLHTYREISSLVSELKNGSVILC